MTTATAADTSLTRAEDAYLHLASFQRGDLVDVNGQPGTVTTAQQHYTSRLERAFLVVDGCGTRTRVSVASLLAGIHVITSRSRQTTAQVRDRLQSLTVDDAVIASAILAEISAGHEEGAERLFAQSGLGDLDVADLEDLCRRFGVDFDDDRRD